MRTTGDLAPGWGERVRGGSATVLAALAGVAVPLAAGFGFVRLFSPTLHNRYFPWITGRALGIAGYLSLTVLVAFGVWMRHPWRLRWAVVHGETRLRVHAALGAATVAVVAGHVVSLATDRYAGVGWVGAFVPGLSRYRTLAVALGTVALVLLLLVAVTARFAGRRGARRWLAYHRLAAATFALVWVHGVLAGTDTRALRDLYLVTGGLVALVVLTRYLAREPRRALPASLPADPAVSGHVPAAHARGAADLATTGTLAAAGAPSAVPAAGGTSTGAVR